MMKNYAAYLSLISFTDLLCCIIIFSFQFSLGYYDTYFMYWPRNRFRENYVFLLGKNTTRSKSSKVFVSTDYGKSFTSQNLTSPSTPSPLIDQIYYGKADPHLVRQITVRAAVISCVLLLV